MKRYIALMGIVLSSVFIAIVSYRLSTDALSILIGALLGMVTILPSLAVVSFLLKKTHDAMNASQAQSHHQPQPPVIVVSGGMMPAQYAPTQSPHSPSTQPILPPRVQTTPRKFHLMGYEESDPVEISENSWLSAD